MVDKRFRDLDYSGKSDSSKTTKTFKMLSKLPTTKIKSSLKNRFDSATLPKMHSMAWLNYQMFLKRLGRLAADNAKQDKSSVIRDSHVRDAAKTILSGIRG